MGKFDLILSLGLLVGGGYVFYKYLWPRIEGELENFGAGPTNPVRDIEYETPVPNPPTASILPYPVPTTTIVEDRFPDVVVEDRYPDYYPYPTPIYQPPIYGTPLPICGPGRYWNGERCKKVDCGPGMLWDDGRCRIDCPDGWRYDDGICKPKNCDRDEYFNGRRCVKFPRDRPRRIPNCGRDEYYNGSRCVKYRFDRDRDWDGDRDRDRDGTRDRNRRILNSRDRWHEDRDRDELKKLAAVPPAEEDKDEEEPTIVEKILNPKEAEAKEKRARRNRAIKLTPETDRLKDITEKAAQNFLEVWYA